MPTWKPTIAPLEETSDPPPGVPRDHLAKGGVVRQEWTIPIPVQDHVWNTWIGTTTASTWVPTTTSITVQDHVWTQWGGFTTASTNAATSIRLMGQRMEDLAGTWTAVRDEVWGHWTIAHRQEQLSAEQEQARADELQRQREAESRRRLALSVKRAKASKRAEELLEMILTPEERLQRENTGKVVVHGNAGGMYEIRMDREYGTVHGNITKVDEHGCRLGNLCVAPEMYDYSTREGLPLADGWVGQILGIKFNEAEFVAKANWSRRQECTARNVVSLDRVA